MKIVGAVSIGLGLAFIIYFLFRLLTGSQQVLSPIPTDKGIKVIYISPTQKK